MTKTQSFDLVTDVELHNEPIGADVFVARLLEAIGRFELDAYAQRPYVQPLAKWVDDFQEWLTIDEVTRKNKA